MTVAEDILAWTQECFSEIRESGPLAMIGLMHYAANGQETPLHSVNSQSGGAKWTAESVAQTMTNLSQRHARGFSSMSQFQLVAVWGPSGKPGSYLPFQLAGQPAAGGMGMGLGFGGVAGDPTGGVLGAAVRMAEVMFQGNIGLMPKLLSEQGLMLERANKRLNEVEVVLRDIIKAQGDAKVGIMREERTNFLIKEGFRVGPGIVNHLSGHELLPANLVNESLADGVLDLLSDEEFLAKIEKLPPARKAALVGQWAEAKRKRAAMDDELHGMAADAEPVSMAAAEADAAGCVTPRARNGKTNGAAGSAVPTEAKPGPDFMVKREHHCGSIGAARALVQAIAESFGHDVKSEWDGADMIVVTATDGQAKGLTAAIRVDDTHVRVGVRLPAHLKLAAAIVESRVAGAVDERLAAARTNGVAAT